MPGLCPEAEAPSVGCRRLIELGLPINNRGWADPERGLYTRPASQTRTVITGMTRA